MVKTYFVVFPIMLVRRVMNVTEMVCMCVLHLLFIPTDSMTVTKHIVAEKKKMMSNK